MKAYEGRFIGLGIAVAFAVITYIIIPLIKAIFRRLSSRSRRSFTPRFSNYSRRPIAITIVGVLGILASLANLGIGMSALWSDYFDFFSLVAIVSGFLGLIGSFTLFRMKRIAAIMLLITLLLYNIAGVYVVIVTEGQGFLASGLVFIISLLPSWILLKHLPDMD